MLVSYISFHPLSSFVVPLVPGNTNMLSEDMKKYSTFKQKFQQQCLPAWQPILTADTVLPAFFLIGLMFIPLGAALLLFSNSVQEKQLDYTDCLGELGGPYSGLPCQQVIGNSTLYTQGPCICKLAFTIENSFEKNVYMYYGLGNLYQNHRRYVKSRDDKQLLGSEATSADSNCSHFGEDEKRNIYAPCGAIANSMFNDTLSIIDSDGSEVKTHKTGIAWNSDKERKFNNPPGSLDAEGAFKGTVQPRYWTKPVYELDVNDPLNNGYENEDLIVWMRMAAFPSFRKLNRRIDHDQRDYKHGMPAGNYTLEVNYNYPVVSFGGSKRFILSTTSFLGGKNNFLGIAYIAVGVVCLVLGCIFLIIHIKFGKRPADLQNITQNTHYSEYPIHHFAAGRRIKFKRREENNNRETNREE